jgi:hypothetical protein
MEDGVARDTVNQLAFRNGIETYGTIPGISYRSQTQKHCNYQISTGSMSSKLSECVESHQAFILFLGAALSNLLNLRILQSLTGSWQIVQT